MTQISQKTELSPAQLEGCRVIALLNGNDVFGHERGNIEVFKSLRDAGAMVRVGINRLDNGGNLRRLLDQLEFETFLLPFGCQWSKSYFRRHPTLIFKCLWKLVRSSWILEQQIRSFKPTHLHLGNPLAYSYIAPTLKLTRIPMIYRAGDGPPETSGPNMMIWKSCMTRANTIVANSEFVRTSIEGAAGSIGGKTRLIYNRAPRPATENTKRLWPDSQQHILYLGQISEHKGTSLLVDAASELVSRYPEIVFDFVGGSTFTQNYQAELKNRIASRGISDRIRFHGTVTNPESYFQSSILHVAPSMFEEPAANVVLEAKRAGIPSVVFPSGGLPELVDHGVNGLICPEKTVESLIEAISYLLDNETTRAEYGRAAQVDLGQRFGEDRFNAEWIEVYQSVRSSGRKVSV